MREKGLHVKRKVKNLIGEVPKLSIKDRIDFCPVSVLMPNQAEARRLKEICGDVGQTREGISVKCGFEKYDTNADVCDATKAINSGLGISVFNPDLAQKILALYAPKNANILDQFGGGGTRGIIAAMMGHKYTGVELRKEEVKRIKKQMDKLNLKFNILVGDSTYYSFENEEFDFSYTCPPYYDLEVYSDDVRDLSFYESYEGFMIDMQKVFQHNYQALKSGSFSVWVVGNFRDKDGRLRHFNGDVVRGMKEAGFVLWDELIWQGASSMAALRSGQFLANRKIVRIHEYILVFKKEA